MAIAIANNQMTNSQLKNIAHLSLGSNVGDRKMYLSSAIDRLGIDSDISVIKQSKIYETEPWPNKNDQDWFLNQVIKIETTLNPTDLLKLCQKIESDLGRESKNDWAPRVIDIDILLFGDEIIDLPDLQIPHRHMNDRQFVLIPLIEIEPGLKDPIGGEKYELILKNVKDKHTVRLHF